MHKRQRGVTFIGWLFLLLPMAIVGYALIRLVPFYLNYLRVARSLDQVVREVKMDEAGAQLTAIKISLDRHFEIDSIDYPATKDITIRKDAAKGWVLEAKYEEVAPLFGNLQLLISFDKIATAG